MDTLNTPHDRGYKWLLSSREIFLQLIKSFIDQPWVSQVDEKEIKRADKSFIAKDFLEKEADLVYEVNLQGQTVVFYILIELQRKVDFSMPYRLLNYMSGIWQNHLNLLAKPESAEQKDFRLPAIVPIVIYNGTQSWTAARTFREMLAGEQLFGNNLLNFEYILLDINRYKDETLLGLSNTIGAAFILDKNSRKPKELRKLLNELFASLQNTTKEELVIFLRWMRYIIQPRLSPEQQETFEVELTQLSMKEAKKMVFANLEKSLDNIEEEGLQKGLQKGLQRGREEGIELTALEMLRDKVNANKISQYTKLPMDKIQELMKKL